MKDKFQSKAVPRGTRTIWRYLGALFILFTFAIGNVWAADTVFKCKLNGSVVQERNDGNSGDFFSFSFSSGSFGWKGGTDVTGCTYDGVNYTSAMKFDSKPTLSFTTTESATVIVVQSTSKNSSKAPKFDGTAMTSKTEISGANVWTITDVAAGSHNVRYSSEIWIHCVYVVYPAPAVNYTVTIDPNGGAYAEDPDGWTKSAGVYTKSIASGTSFTAPAGLTKGTDDLSWKDGDGNAITFPVTISGNITFVAQWTAHSASSDATLKALEVAGCTLNETFNPANLDYTVTLPFYASAPETSAVTATKNDANATVGDVTYDSTNKKYSVTVTAEDNSTKKTYTITLNWAATPTASSSINIEQLVLENSTKYNIGDALDAAHIAYVDKDALDSLKDQSGRNEPYLGLKFKKSSSKITVVVPAEKVLNIKWGNISTAIKVKINDESQSDITTTATGSIYHLDAANIVRQVEFSVAADKKTFVLKQVMVGEDIKTVTLPWLVTYDAGEHGTCATAKETWKAWKGTALTLPSLETLESGWDFNGWNDGVNTYAAGASYTPSADVTLTAQYTAQASPFDLTALTYKIGTGDAVNVGYEDGTFTYNIELPYKPSYDAITVAPTLKVGTSYLKGDEVLTVSSLPGAATFTVVEAGGANEKQYTVNFTKAPKDGICLIKANVGNNTFVIDETASLLSGTAEKNNVKSESEEYEGKTGWKFNSKGAYLGLTLAGTETFQANDVVKVFITRLAGDAVNTKVYVYTDKTTADLNSVLLASSVADQAKGENTVILPSTTTNKIYLCRGADTKDYQDWNPYVAYVAVYRAMNPVLKSITFNSTDVAVSSTSVSATLPYGTNLSSMTVTPEIVWNGAAAENSILINGSATGAWAWGENTYKLTDKDGDATTYTITLTEADHYEAMIVGGANYETLAAAVSAADADDVVKLLDNVDLMATGLTIAENITLDLNGFNIKAGEQATNDIMVPAGKKLTLVDNSTGADGKIYTEEAYTASAACGVIRVAGEFLMQSGNIYTVIESDPVNLGQFAVVIASGGKVTVEGGRITAGWYAISNNGLNSGSTIIVSGGELISTKDYAIYNPSANSTVTVSGGVVYGAAGGIVMNRGDLVVTGGTITSNNQGTTGTWGDGTGGLGNAAIYANGKYESVTVEISGGTVVAEGGAIMITNGTINPVEIAISGGQFSHVVPAEYCAEGFAPVTEPNAQGKYEVEDKRIYIFDGSTMSNMATSPSTGAITWEIVGSTMGAGDKDKTYQDVHYTRALSCGNSSTTKHFRIDVAENNNAKIEVIGMSNSDKDKRHAWLTNSTDKGEYANAIAGIETTGYNPEYFGTDWLEEGSYYLHADNTVAIFLIRVTPKAVDPKCEAPVIDAQPVSKLTFGPTENLTTSVTAHVSEGSLSYQWYNATDNSKVTGATSATLTTTTEGTYYVIVTNTLASHRDNSTKSDEATLAYRDATDATLSALTVSEGTLAPTFDPAVVEYDVYLPEGTTTVPTLTATATMHPYPTVTISDATEFVSYEATSTVTVKSEDETVTNTYTVIFHVAHSVASLVDVTENTTWDWTTITARADGSEIDEIISGKAHGPRVATADGLVLANYVLGGDNWDKIEGNNGAYAIRSNSNKFYQGASLRIHTTVPGYLMIRGRNDGSNMTLKVQNAGRDIELGALPKDNFQDFIVFVEAGDVVMYNVPATAGKPMRIGKIEFTVRTNPTPDYTRDEMLGNGVYGTICLPNNVPAGAAFGATFFELTGRENTYGKLVLDEVTELAAGVPYVFEAHGDVINIFYGETHVDYPVNQNGMYGTFEAQTITELTGVYYFAQRALWSCVDLTSLSLPANRAYVKLGEVDYLNPSQQAPAAGRRRITMNVNGENQAQGFENIESGDKPMKVMIEGTMYILRGEKVFDATGRLVQ